MSAIWPTRTIVSCSLPAIPFGVLAVTYYTARAYSPVQVASYYPAPTVSYFASPTVSSTRGRVHYAVRVRATAGDEEILPDVLAVAVTAALNITWFSDNSSKECEPSSDENGPHSLMSLFYHKQRISHILQRNGDHFDFFGVDYPSIRITTSGRAGFGSLSQHPECGHLPQQYGHVWRRPSSQRPLLSYPVRPGHSTRASPTAPLPRLPGIPRFDRRSQELVALGMLPRRVGTPPQQGVLLVGAQEG